VGLAIWRPVGEDLEMIDIDALPTLLQLDPIGDHHYEGKPENAGDVRNVVFGGQILAQMIVAAHLDRNAERDDAKEVKSIHAIFARAGDYTAPIEYEVERMHDGRSLGSDTVTFAQNGKIMSRGLLLWSTDEPDLIRHTETVQMPDVPAPEDVRPDSSGLVFPGAEARIVDDINVWSASQPVGPARQNIWTRYSTNYAPVVNQAILAWATDGWLIGTAMLPHEGISQDQAHRTISTGVVSHTLNFHDRYDADEWLLLANESIWAGRGRTHGRCNIWTRDGRLVATYTQDNLVRAFADRSDHTGDYNRIM
jgi:acyl-CoA thioesterase II